MTKEQAIEAAIAIWTHVVETGEKPAYANQYRFKCPLCDLYNNINRFDRSFYKWKANHCLDCPLYDGIGRSQGCCQEYENWCNTEDPQDQHTYAQVMLAKLRTLL